MCGLAGKISLDRSVSLVELKRAADALRHRGPDDEGIFLCADSRCGLAHRRLSLLDLSSNGHQPMSTHDGKLHIVYNGEIYNHPQLRKQLSNAGYSFQTHTDTEVILFGYLHWGKEVVKYLKGMFAFVIVDEKNEKLVLSRDRFGIKPLYFARQGRQFFFGSELKAILAMDGFSKSIRKASVGSFLANRYVADNYTMWEDIRQLSPGTLMVVDFETLQSKVENYWRLPLEQYADNDADFHFREKLINSISTHLLSDVPVGSFLSGGYDSSAIVTIMQKVLEYPTKAFSIGFEGWKQSEHLYALKVANLCGAKLETLLLNGIDLEVMPQLMYHYDDPIADISILPTYAVSKLASKHVKAVLSGEGADELLVGYWWQKPENLFTGRPWQHWWRKIAGISKKDIKTHYIQAMSMGLYDRETLKKALLPEWASAQVDDPFSHFDALMKDELSVLKQIQLLDIHTFMGELVLKKVDRASMAHGLEVRVPFLDHQLVEWLFCLPEEQYFNKKIQKILLHNFLKEYLPETILNRHKQGFVGPDVFYMDYGLYDRTLTNSRLVNDGVVRYSFIRNLLARKDHWRLWKLFVLEHWWRVWV